MAQRTPGTRTARTMKTANRQMQKAECRRQKCSIRTAAASACNRCPLRSTRAPAAFTLIELLVVIGVIVLLAALDLSRHARPSRPPRPGTRARAELTQIETAIETYKTKLGFYPPDNPPTDQLDRQPALLRADGDHSPRLADNRLTRPWTAAPRS